MGRIMLATSASTDEEYGGTTDFGAVKIDTKAYNTNLYLNPVYKEFFIEANIENDTSVIIPMTLTRTQLDVNGKTFRTGYYVNSSNYGTIAITVVISGNDTYLKLTYFNIGGTTYNNSVMTVYGK